MNCIILEDEALALSVMEDYVGKVPFLRLSKSFRSPLSALEYVNLNRPELLFVDINMPDLSGLDFLDNLRYEPYVIFTTAYSEYALKSFDYNTLDYLLKPIRFNRFLKAVTKAHAFTASPEPLKNHNDNQPPPHTIYLKNSGGIHRISLDTLLYVESIKNYVVYTTKDRTIEFKQSLSEVEKTLPRGLFLRVHRSYVVNVQFIQSLRYDGLLLTNDQKLPVGRSYRDGMKKFMGLK